MGLQESMPATGRWLFKYRGQLPVIIFLLAYPAVSFTDYTSFTPDALRIINYSAFACSVLGFLIRCYTVGTTPTGTSGRNTKEQVAEQLNTTGIYSMVRHPLYLGNYLMWLGILIYTKNIYFTLTVSLMYWLYYERIMMAEEDFLSSKFGAAFKEWSSVIPAFLPRLGGFVPPSEPFSLKQVLRREYSGVLATVIGFVYVQQLIGLSTHGSDYIISSTYKATLLATAIAALVLRSLKKYTRLLD
jgi:protein-S-isoprenylcysteine O-methyltransferase Ste14